MYQKYLSAAVLATLLATGCTTGIYDGMKLPQVTSSFTPSGFVTAPPGAGDKVRVQVLNGSNWVTVQDNIAIKATSAWTMASGHKLYQWTAPATTLPYSYWRKLGRRGHYVGMRAQWLISGNWYTLPSVRHDWVQCVTEDFNGESNTLSYVVDNCFSHQTVTWLYTEDYDGPYCRGPLEDTPMVQGHYMLEDMPECGQAIVASHMRGKIDEDELLRHYEINHDSSNSMAVNALADDSDGTCSQQPGSDGQCSLGGFFGGHARYLKRMERHLSVYNYPWTPLGKIPGWNGKTTIPESFRDAELSYEDSCDSAANGCTGWRTEPLVNVTPNVAKPAGLSAGAVCNFVNADAVASQAANWDQLVHDTAGGYFASMDSPASPLFYAWHNTINDVQLDYANCR